MEQLRYTNRVLRGVSVPHLWAKYVANDGSEPAHYDSPAIISYGGRGKHLIGIFFAEQCAAKNIPNKSESRKEWAVKHNREYFWLYPVLSGIQLHAESKQGAGKGEAVGGGAHEGLGGETVHTQAFHGGLEFLVEQVEHKSAQQTAVMPGN